MSWTAILKALVPLSIALGRFLDWLMKVIDERNRANRIEERQRAYEQIEDDPVGYAVNKFGDGVRPPRLAPATLQQAPSATDSENIHGV
jgi:hypothetical protein